MKPFLDSELCDTSWVRVFDISKTTSDEYVWHRDVNNRVIRVLNGEGWKFQFDNELPFDINKDDEFFVPRMVYHRIIPGKTSLRIKIDEMVKEDKLLAAN